MHSCRHIGSEGRARVSWGHRPLGDHTDPAQLHPLEGTREMAVPKEAWRNSGAG